MCLNTAKLRPEVIHLYFNSNVRSTISSTAYLLKLPRLRTLERHIKRARAVNTPTSAQLKGQQLYVKRPASIRRINKVLFLECLRVQTLHPMLSKIVA